MGQGLKMSKRRKRARASRARAQSGRMRMRATSWPATSSMTTKPGSLRWDSRATMVEAGIPMRVTAMAAMAVAMASVVAPGWKRCATPYQSRTAAILP